jgi:hypothetical protein
VTNVIIRNLTFDGNRYGFGTAPSSGFSAGSNLSCLAGNAPYWDLATGGDSNITVEWVDFINAPGTALQLEGTGSSVSLSSFGQGTANGIGPNGGGPGSESGAESATRSTAIYINNSYNGAYYNNVAYAGTAGITLNGSFQTAYGNYLFQNRYELSDWNTGPADQSCANPPCIQQGGQLTLTGDTNQTLSGGCSSCSSNATVAANVIIGNGWPSTTDPPPYPAQATKCPWGNGQAFNAGVEAYGFGHFFYNNEINTNTGSGMQFAGSNPTGNITISSANPIDSSDRTRSIEANSHSGIAFLGPATNTSFTHPAVGVTLDDVIVQQTGGGYGVVLDSVGTYGTYLGFTNNSCMSVNIPDNVHVIGTSGLGLVTAPQSYNSLRGGACPTSGYPLPAPTHVPGWSW